MDPILPLSFSMRSDYMQCSVPGAGDLSGRRYHPTGWEVNLDLIGHLVAATGEGGATGSNPEVW